MKLTIIIPTYNRARLLDHALQSVAKQTTKPYEVLIIDNASTDATDQTVAKYKQYKFRYIKNDKNLGMFKSFNKAIALSKGDYVSFLQSDDLIAPNWYETWAQIIEKHKVKHYISPFAVIDDNGHLKYIKRHYKESKLLKYPHVIQTLIKDYVVPSFGPTAATIYHKSIFKKVGTFDDRYKTEADSIHSLKILNHYDTYYYSEVLCAVRHHIMHGYDKKVEKVDLTEELNRLNNYFKLLNEFSKDFKDKKWSQVFLYTNYCMRLAYINVYLSKAQWKRVFSYYKITNQNTPGFFTDWQHWLLLIKVQIKLLQRARSQYTISPTVKNRLNWLEKYTSS